MLMRRSWPGNVRELRNFIERSVSLGSIDQASRVAPLDRAAGLAPLDSGGPHPAAPAPEGRAASVDRELREHLRAEHAEEDRRQPHARRRARGVNRRFMQRLLARLGLRASDVAVDADDEK